MPSPDKPALSLVQLREQLAGRRKVAIDAFRQHLRPDTLLTALRRSVDQALRELVRLHPLPQGATLAAVGGYGRGELYPFSDVDVLVLLREPPGPRESGMIEALITAMWDLGIEPGHSVRTVQDCQQEAATTLRSRPHCWKPAGWSAARICCRRCAPA
jgi:[protein-PII] uridylyltransferase